MPEHIVKQNTLPKLYLLHKSKLSTVI